MDNEIIGNRTLAARAREIAAVAEPGSLLRRAAGCAAVAFGTTKTTAAARKVLDEVGIDDIREAAVELLGQLLANGQEAVA